MAPPKDPPHNSSLISHLFTSPVPLYTLSILLRFFLLLYGLWQDANSPLKYTDIDYLVFTDAARFLSHHHQDGPYARETYRYTPLLSWMLLPTTWTAHFQWLSVAYFSFGKVLFALADLVAGWLIVKVLTMSQRRGGGGGGGGMSAVRARKFAAIWLLNPMVATISTRGSSEGLLAVMVMALLCAVLSRRFTLVGILLGLGVHFKIYPFIYAPAIVWWMDEDHIPSTSPSSLTSASPLDRALAFLTTARLKLALVSLITFTGLNLMMYALYGHPFLQHTYLHHVTRIDHRHNFSPYNILLYLTSAHLDGASAGFRIESVAFLPQLLLSCVLIPFVMAKKDLPSTMLAQTWAFVAFNKVCTSQKYFIWYLIFLPLYLPRSSFLRNPKSGIAALLLWILTQAAWLQQGYALEFLGESTFVPGLWLSGLAFFLANCWILGIIVADVA
ncbi:GPI mannosyltransferase 1 [Cytospora mali]|uniref:GPI mannosyltransferase 1 n=1 Tax=Cytospora mali TaxID=578113 RepID=A0A194UVR6_CYTMA|nr:GPI mannosyltransferase 1 [Valsa mali var. pyri (nom. inval.)]